MGAFWGGDYGFFVPTEAAGRLIIAEGTAFRELAEDEESVEYLFVADGVLLGR